MSRKIFSVMCKCWDVIFCTCKNMIHISEQPENTVTYWKRIEHVDQYIKKRS